MRSFSTKTRGLPSGAGSTQRLTSQPLMSYLGGRIYTAIIGFKGFPDATVPVWATSLWIYLRPQHPSRLCPHVRDGETEAQALICLCRRACKEQNEDSNSGLYKPNPGVSPACLSLRYLVCQERIPPAVWVCSPILAPFIYLFLCDSIIPERVGFLVSSCGSWGLNLGPWVWLQAPFLTEPSHLFRSLIPLALLSFSTIK